LPARRRPHNSRDECWRRGSPFFGLASEVDNGDNRAHGGAIAAIIQDELSPLLIGKDASRIERLWADMFALSIPNRDRKLVMEAIACVETALWDLLGKSLGAAVAGGTTCMFSSDQTCLNYRL